MVPKCRGAPNDRPNLPHPTPKSAFRWCLWSIRDVAPSLQVRGAYINLAASPVARPPARRAPKPEWPVQVLLGAWDSRGPGPGCGHCQCALSGLLNPGSFLLYASELGAFKLPIATPPWVSPPCGAESEHRGQQISNPRRRPGPGHWKLKFAGHLQRPPARRQMGAARCA